MQKLGQHFMVSKRAIKTIVAALGIEAGDEVIEVGPGRGALTLPLARECEEWGAKLIAIEKDGELAAQLAARNLKVGIVRGDVRSVLPELSSRLRSSRIKIVGNIPYYLTGNLLRIISGLDPLPVRTVLTIQREVGERLIMQPPRMNLLAASVQVWAEPSVLLLLKPDDFIPPPEVDSAVVLLATRAEPLARDLGTYYELMRAVFKQPRKTLGNNLRAGLRKETAAGLLETLERLGVESTVRPQDLSIEVLATLTNRIAR
jgi:16S rRNA (adenine1518-N6/adenine1519-N6)-dimethyltransferase